MDLNGNPRRVLVLNMVEEWLLKQEEYIPKDDKSKFIDKSILSIIKLLSKIHRRNTSNNRILYRLNPSLKVVFTFINLILISLTRSKIYLIAIGIYGLCSLALLDREERRIVIGISLTIPLFTLIMLIPSMIAGNINNSILLLFKVGIDILLVNILSYTTKWHDITKSLKLFFIPDIFIWTMEITIKYVVLLGEYGLNLLYSLKLKSIGKNDGKYNSISGIMGNLFLKSKHMGEEMFSAMECRGFTGEYNVQRKLNITKIDIAYGVVNMGSVAVFIFTRYFNVLGA